MATMNICDFHKTASTSAAINREGTDGRLVYAVKRGRLVYAVERGRFRHCAKSRKVAGSIPDGVTGIFY